MMTQNQAAAWLADSRKAQTMSDEKALEWLRKRMLPDEFGCLRRALRNSAGDRRALKRKVGLPALH